MRKSTLGPLALLSALLLAGSAGAVPIANDSTNFTTDGASYLKNFAVGGSTGAKFIMDFWGDYGIYSNENLTVYIDGDEIFSAGYDNPNGFTITTNVYHYSYHVTGDYMIDDVDWAAYIADGNIEVSWQNGSGVTYYSRYTNQVTWSLDATLSAAPVPEPSAVALFGTGFVVVGAVRRRRR